jgi:Fic-DOC domain mobile mystery protein B
MSDPLFDEDDDANTPLEADEREGLIPSYITLRRELNEAEQANIAAAMKWLSSRKRDVLDETFLRTLHKRMFGQVWRWAGDYRRSARNIGVDAYRIPMDMAQAIDDARYWVDIRSSSRMRLPCAFHIGLLRSTRFRMAMVASRALSVTCLHGSSGVRPLPGGGPLLLMLA